MNAKQLARVLDTVNGGGLLTCCAVQDGMANDTYDVTSTNGRYIVRHLIVHECADSSLKAHARGRNEILTRLQHAGGSFPYSVPCLLIDSNGEQTVDVDGARVEVYRYIEGEVTWSPKPEQTAARGRALAMFHEVLVNVNVDIGNPARHKSFEVRRRLARVARLKANEVAKVIAAAAARAMPLYQKLAERLPDAADGFEVGAQRVLHGDFHKGNVLFNGDQVSGIIDFDHLSYGYRLIDIATALSNENTWGTFLAAYAEVAPIGDDEVQLLVLAKALTAIKAFTTLVLRRPRNAQRTAAIIQHRANRDAWILKAVEKRG